MKILVSIVMASLVVPNCSWARSDLDTRVSRLENIVANELNVKLLNQLEAMQQEIRELRGKVEEQQNSVVMLNQKQEKLFLNLDARLNNINKTAASMPAPVEQAPTHIADPIPPVEQAPISSAPISDEKTLYEAANALVRNKKYADAIIEFKDLLWQFPEGAYAAHAYYWLGELYMVQWQQNRAEINLLNQAKEAFTTVTNKYKGQDREGDALLKLGLLEMDQDHFAVAKDLLQQVVNKYPNTARARIAENNLARIEKTWIEGPAIQ